MQEKIDSILQEAIAKISNTDNSKDLEDIRVHYLGKKGELTSLLKTLGSLSKEERPKAGALVNKAKQELAEKIEAAKSDIGRKELDAKFMAEKIDITLPGRKPKTGVKHPLRIVQEEIEDIFLGLGFNIEEGPEIETDYYNFKALNFPDDHPARDAQDTLFVNDSVLFRTQTSPVQIRCMERMAPQPIRAIMPGRVYRRDTLDATHSPQFHQIEGLVIDKNVKFSDLIGILDIVAKRMFGEDKKIRVRPSFFPFTEPSAEIDVSSESGKWLEILGSGAVHPNVLRAGGYDPEIYSGYAFGMGLERIAILKYGVKDIRHFFENDLRFLYQFK